MQSISANLNVMIKAAEKASRALIRDFGEIEKLQVSIKGPTDFVSNADLKAEKIIIEELKKARPYYSIISEEDGSENNKDKEHTWIIDPIDGTTNFLHGVPHFAISIALKYGNEIISGLIYDPITPLENHRPPDGGHGVECSRHGRHAALQQTDRRGPATTAVGGASVSLQRTDRYGPATTAAHVARRRSIAARRPCPATPATPTCRCH